MKALLGLMLLPAAAFAQTDPNCTLPAPYTAIHCGATMCEADAESTSYASYLIPNPYTQYGCTGVYSGQAFGGQYTPPAGDPVPAGDFDPPSAAPEISASGALPALTLLLGGLAILTASRRRR